MTVDSALLTKADQKRQDIIRQSALLFDSAGYAQTTLDHIASAVGLRKPTLYHYFGSKEDILFAIHDELIDRLLAKLIGRNGQEGSASAGVAAFMEDILTLMDTHRGYVRVFFEHYRELAPNKRDAISARRDDYFSLIEAIVRRGVESGEFQAVDVRVTTLGLFGLSSWAYHWYEPSKGMTSVEIASLFSRIAIDGLRMPSSNGRRGR